MTNSRSSRGVDVWVLAPFGKDAALIQSVLAQSGLKVIRVDNGPDLVDAIPERAGVAVISEEALTEELILEIGRKLDTQPPWSDLPIIVLTGGGLSTAATEVAVRSRAPLGNVSLLERPLRAATLISSVRSAIGARQRQFEIRDYLQERTAAEQALRDARDKLETIVEDRTLALRRLSTQLLKVQDDERRRIARELHDSLGQYLAAIKINVNLLALGRSEEEAGFIEIQQLLDRAISETRTLSHLLHPPSLDLAGFASAASWYVEGFGKRSGIRASLSLPENLSRLPVNVETALFRIMQEALTNAHRHSGSNAVDIKLTVDDELAILTVSDFGKGISQEVLDGLRHSGTNVGVGLAGIRERAKELGGTFDIESNESGTILKACVPLKAPNSTAFAARNPSQIYSSLVS
jgi:signal transduction histidine kinase